MVIKRANWRKKLKKLAEKLDGEDDPEYVRAEMLLNFPNDEELSNKIKNLEKQ